MAQDAIPQAHLLAIPGELRNRIFTFCTDTPPTWLNKKLSPTSSLSSTTKWNDEKHQFFGLTRTCHQLRQEFLPVYLSSTTIEVSLIHITQYLQVFAYPQTTNHKEIIGNVNVRLETKGDYEASPITDIYPILQLSAMAPRFKVRFSMSGDYYNDLDCINAMCSPEANPQWGIWSSYLLAHVYRVLVQALPQEGAEKCIVLRKEVREDWMDEMYVSQEKNEEYEEQLYEWCDRVGLKAMREGRYAPEIKYVGKTSASRYFTNEWAKGEDDASAEKV